MREGGVASVMAAYNRVDGEPVLRQPTLLDDMLRARWGFTGYVVSDCGAVDDIEAASQADGRRRRGRRAGGPGRHRPRLRQRLPQLTAALERGLITEADLDARRARLFGARSGWACSTRRSACRRRESAMRSTTRRAHRALAREAARKSMVLLENDGTLPLAPRHSASP